ncbi:MAG: hypothetical protein CL927_09610 [Deltaproteobacteria bacterium]|nr:hypothetical protein [Deltaproteobacteria bacterium]HCH64570.1 SCO family protein [Deltaproteobacteria bacterium]
MTELEIVFEGSGSEPRWCRSRGELGKSCVDGLFQANGGVLDRRRGRVSPSKALGYVACMSARPSLVGPAILALVISAGFSYFALRSSDSMPGPADDMPTFSDFEVRSGDTTVRLSDFKNEVVLVYFGYASCPDICPTTLATVGSAFQLLEPAQLERTRGIFVSVDPERDPPAHVRKYAAFFHPRIVGGTSDAGSIEGIAEDWGIGYERSEGASQAMGYTVDHTSIVFLVAPDGRMKKALPHGTAPAALAEAIVSVLGPVDG